MGFRRSPDRIAAERDWRRFVEHNSTVIAAAGLPPRATATVGEWDDILMHGYLPGDPGAFNIDRLSPVQYASLLEFVSNYFAAGYEFFTPTALRGDDQAVLRARFDRGR